MPNPIEVFQQASAPDVILPVMMTGCLVGALITVIKRKDSLTKAIDVGGFTMLTGIASLAVANLPNTPEAIQDHYTFLILSGILTSAIGSSIIIPGGGIKFLKFLVNKTVLTDD